MQRGLLYALSAACGLFKHLAPFRLVVLDGIQDILRADFKVPGQAVDAEIVFELCAVELFGNADFVFAERRFAAE